MVLKKRIAWNKGIKTGKNPEHSKRMKGKIPWNKNKKGLQKAWNKGKPAPWAKGNFKKGQPSIFKGKKRPNIQGKNHWNWKGGIYPEVMKIRKSLEMELWRTAVFQRDNYTCIWCGTKSGIGKAVMLNADHIKPFALFPELRFAIDNGRTLCRPCHQTTESWGRPKRFNNSAIASTPSAQ